jgi:hypothetical protein
VSADRVPGGFDVQRIADLDRAIARLTKLRTRWSGGDQLSVGEVDAVRDLNRELDELDHLGDDDVHEQVATGGTP